MTLPTPDTVSTADLTLADGRTIAVDAVLVAAGCRAHAKHLAGTIDASTAHPDRLHAVAADVEHLVVTAQRLTERSAHHDGPLERRVEHLRRTADDLNHAIVWTVAVDYPRGHLEDGATRAYVEHFPLGANLDELVLVNAPAAADHLARTVAAQAADLLNASASATGNPGRFSAHLHRSAAFRP